MAESLHMRLRARRDDTGASIPPGPSSPIAAFAVAPGASEDVIALGHNGEDVEYSVYFVPAPSVLTDEHELLVRGGWYAVRTHVWRSPWGTGRSGMVAVCQAKRG